MVVNRGNAVKRDRAGVCYNEMYTLYQQRYLELAVRKIESECHCRSAAAMLMLKTDGKLPSESRYTSTLPLNSIVKKSIVDA